MKSAGFLNQIMRPVARLEGIDDEVEEHRRAVNPLDQFVAPIVDRTPIVERGKHMAAPCIGTTRQDRAQAAAIGRKQWLGACQVEECRRQIEDCCRAVEYVGRPDTWSSDD